MFSFKSMSTDFFFFFQFIVLSCLLAVAHSSVIPVFPAESDYDHNPMYSYAYDVQDSITGDFKSQQETRSGDVVKGSYSLLDSDGLHRTVDYTADPTNGFNAVVQREPVKIVAQNPNDELKIIGPVQIDAKIVEPEIPIAATLAEKSVPIKHPTSVAYTSSLTYPHLSYSSLDPIFYHGSVVSPITYSAPLSYASTSSYSGPVVSAVGGLIAPSYGGSAHGSALLASYSAPVLHL